ncbi:hypothetical protein [Streptomyces sp. NPDC048002]|uniref:hypothetical protein n=1 Tax=Streptomyces sp. NPDC048002 TaxID=3154344 RepID=UPI0033C32AB4
MPVDPEPADESATADRVAESMIGLWRQAHEDVAPTISDEQMRGLLVLETKRGDPTRVAEGLGVDGAAADRLYDRLERRTLVRRDPSGEFCLTGAGKCVLEATRQRRRQLLERTLVTAAPADRPVLRDAIDQLYGVVHPLVRLPRSRSPQ